MKASTGAAATFRNGGPRGRQQQQATPISIRYVIQMALYIEKFHTEHEYGMTYFDLGLISLTTFVKVQNLKF